MKRRTPAARSALPLRAPTMTLDEALARLPIEKTEFNKVLYRWIKIVRCHPMLTPSQRHVGLNIAQQHINRNPDHRWFHSAWASHQRIANDIGVARRTVITAMAALNQIGLLAIEHGGGLSVPGGRTDRYALRMDWLDVLVLAAQVRKKDLELFHGSGFEKLENSVQRGEKFAESGEIGDQMMGNSPVRGVKELHTTYSNNTFLESSSITPSGRSPKPQSLDVTQQACIGRKLVSGGVTAQDHLSLAGLLGGGEVERGFSRLNRLNEADVDDLAVRYRRDKSSGPALQAEAARLEENLRR
jgi:hypothetical protein